MTTQAIRDARALERAMPAMTSPEGAMYEDLAPIIGRPAGQVDKIAGRWIDLGLCVRIRWPRNCSPSRLFATQGQADAFVADNGATGQSYSSTAMEMARELGDLPLTSGAFVARVAPAPLGTSAILFHLVTRGQLFSCVVGRDRAFFLTQAQADAFAARPDKWQMMPRWKGRAAPVQKPPKTRRVKTGRLGAQQVTPLRPSVAPGVSVKTPKPAQIADYSRAVYNRDTATRPTARYQMLVLAPDQRWPSFASIPLGATLGG